MEPEYIKRHRYLSLLVFSCIKVKKKEQWFFKYRNFIINHKYSNNIGNYIKEIICQKSSFFIHFNWKDMKVFFSRTIFFMFFFFSACRLLVDFSPYISYNWTIGNLGICWPFLLTRHLALSGMSILQESILGCEPVPKYLELYFKYIVSIFNRIDLTRKINISWQS